MMNNLWWNPLGVLGLVSSSQEWHKLKEWGKGGKISEILSSEVHHHFLKDEDPEWLRTTTCHLKALPLHSEMFLGKGHLIFVPMRTEYKPLFLDKSESSHHWQHYLTFSFTIFIWLLPYEWEAESPKLKKEKIIICFLTVKVIDIYLTYVASFLLKHKTYSSCNFPVITRDWCKYYSNWPKVLSNNTTLSFLLNDLSHMLAFHCFGLSFLFYICPLGKHIWQYIRRRNKRK